MADEYYPRKPRHKASGAEVEVGVPPDTVKAQLLNLSRDGFRLRVPFRPRVREPITMRLCDETSGIRLTLLGVVRWRRADGDHWLAGCQSSSRLDLETLGELLLNGILVADPA